MPNRGFTRDKLQAFGNSFVRLLVKMAMVPEIEALRLGPVGNQPDFLGPVERAEDFHLYEARLLIHEVRAMAERLLDLSHLVISDYKFAERNKRASGLGADRLSRHEARADRSDCFVKWAAGGWRRFFAQS